MAKISVTDLLEAGAHFGHLTRRWNPKMKPYIFMEKNGIHIIDLKKTLVHLEEAAENLSKLAAEGKSILFVGTKKQAKNIIESEARRCGQFWVSERWLGGMLTNFSTIRKSVKRLHNLEKEEVDGTFDKITKKERLYKTREREKLKKILEGIENMSKLPGALVVIDISKEDIAVKEAKKLNIPVFAIVDTNCDPDPIDYVIPCNDDASRAVDTICRVMADSIIEGNAKSKELRAHEAAEKEKERKIEDENSDKRENKGRVRKVRFEGKDNRGERGERKDRREKTETAAEKPAPEKPADSPAETPAS